MDNNSLKQTKKKLVAPLICGQILFLQVSTNTSTARPDASKHSRRSDVRAKNLHGKIKASERKVLLIPSKTSTVLTVFVTGAITSCFFPRIYIQSCDYITNFPSTHAGKVSAPQLLPEWNYTEHELSNPPILLSSQTTTPETLFCTVAALPVWDSN